MVLSLFWKRTTRNGIVVGMVLGAVTVVVWHTLGYDAHMKAILPGTIMSYLGVVGISLWDKPPSAEIISEFEKVLHLCKTA
jgi:sodium/proline symporter